MVKKKSKKKFKDTHLTVNDIVIGKLSNIDLINLRYLPGFYFCSPRKSLDSLLKCGCEIYQMSMTIVLVLS